MRKEMIRKITMVALVCGLLLPASPAMAYFEAYIAGNLPMPELDDYTLGGIGTAFVEYDETATHVEADFEYTLRNKSFADVVNGTVGAGVWVTTVVDPSAPQNRGGGGSDITPAKIHDEFTIGPGNAGLNIGDPVQILFRSTLTGEVVFTGTENDFAGVSLGFTSTLTRSGVSLASFTYSTGGSLSAPTNLLINEGINQIVNVNIGDTLVLEMQMNEWFIGTTHAPGTVTANFGNFASSGTGQLGYAPGFEDIEISSEGGALVIPEPATLLLLSMGLVGLAGRTRRRLMKKN